MGLEMGGGEDNNTPIGAVEQRVIRGVQQCKMIMRERENRMNYYLKGKEGMGERK